MRSSFPVAIIGGGPVGLAAAAHLVKRNKAFILIEKGEEVGAALWQWKHVRLFSPMVSWEHWNVTKKSHEAKAYDMKS